jgi:hypothetical protein
MFQIVQQNDFQAGNGTNYQLKMTIGLLHQGLYIHNKNSGAPITLSDLTAMRLKLNGTDYLGSMSGTEMDEINKYDGLPAFDGIDFYLPFGLESMKDQRMRELTYLNTGRPSPVNGKVIDSCVLELDFANAVDLSFFSLADTATDEGPGLVRRFNVQNKAASAGSYVDVTNFPKGTLQWLYWRRIFTRCTNGGDITAQKMFSTKQTYFGEQIPKSVLQGAAAAGGHTPGTYWKGNLDFTALNNGYPALAKTVPAAAGTAGGPSVQPDTPFTPFLPTLPLKDTDITVQTFNDNTANVTNYGWLEAIGQID